MTGASSGSKPSDDATTNRATERLAYEAHHLREDMAALKALGKEGERVRSPFYICDFVSAANRTFSRE
jgi:hypothetical protein